MAEVTVAKRFEVPAAHVWDRIGDPAELASWHPAVETTKVVDGGATRINTVVGGARVVEPILERAGDRYTFRITDSPLPLSDFVSTLRVAPEGERACRVEWGATFRPAGVPENEASEIVRGFFQAGLDAL